MYNWFSESPVIFGGLIPDFLSFSCDFETQFVFGSAAWVQLVVLYQNVLILFQRCYRNFKLISLLDEANSRGKIEEIP